LFAKVLLLYCATLAVGLAKAATAFAHCGRRSQCSLLILLLAVTLQMPLVCTAVGGCGNAAMCHNAVDLRSRLTDQQRVTAVVCHAHIVLLQVLPLQLNNM
jgi:predicted anti-sigma-YlaC factor YlaD